MIWTLCVCCPGALAASPQIYFMPPRENAHTGMTANPLMSADRNPAMTRQHWTFAETSHAITPYRNWLPQDFSTLSKVGPLDIERARQSPLMEEHGITTTFSYPLKSIPGMDLTASFFGGHRDTIQGAAGGSAAITGGIRMRW